MPKPSHIPVTVTGKLWWLVEQSLGLERSSTGCVCLVAAVEKWKLLIYGWKKAGTSSICVLISWFVARLLGNEKYTITTINIHFLFIHPSPHEWLAFNQAEYSQPLPSLKSSCFHGNRPFLRDVYLVVFPLGHFFFFFEKAEMSVGESGPRSHVEVWLCFISGRHCPWLMGSLPPITPTPKPTPSPNSHRRAGLWGIRHDATGPSSKITEVLSSPIM